MPKKLEDARDAELLATKLDVLGGNQREVLRGQLGLFRQRRANRLIEGGARVLLQAQELRSEASGDRLALGTRGERARVDGVKLAQVRGAFVPKIPLRLGGGVRRVLIVAHLRSRPLCVDARAKLVPGED